VAVVSEDVANEIGRSPLGLALKMEKPVEIVGVAAKARYSRLTERTTVPPRNWTRIRPS